MRMRFVALGLATLVVLGGWFFAAFKPARSKLADVRADIKTTQAEVAALEQRLAHLKDLQRNEKSLREQAARFNEALPAKHGVPDFIRKLEDASKQAQMDFLSISPSVPSAGVVSVSLSGGGKFFAIEDFVAKLEKLDRAVRVDDFSLSGGSSDAGGSPSLSLSIKMRIFTNTAAAAPAAPAAPAASPTTGS